MAGKATGRSDWSAPSFFHRLARLLQRDAVELALLADDFDDDLPEDLEVEAGAERRVWELFEEPLARLDEDFSFPRDDSEPLDFRLRLADVDRTLEAWPETTSSWPGNIISRRIPLSRMSDFTDV